MDHEPAVQDSRPRQVARDDDRIDPGKDGDGNPSGAQTKRRGRTHRPIFGVRLTSASVGTGRRFGSPGRTPQETPSQDSASFPGKEAHEIRNIIWSLSGSEPMASNQAR